MRIPMAALCTVTVLAQTPAKTQGRAKDAFLDTSSTVVVYVPKARARPSRPTSGPPVPANGRAPREAEIAVSAPKNVGVRYHIELLAANGEITRVPSTRAFASGEKIRLQVTSNVGGRLTVLQSVNGSAPQQLFPGPKTAPDDSIIRARTPILIPSGGFRFAPPASTIELTLRLDPEVHRTEKPASAVAVAHEATPDLIIADVPLVEDTVSRKSIGAKSLLLEEDGPETTVVQPVSNRLEPLVTTIQLKQVR